MLINKFCEINVDSAIISVSGGRFMDNNSKIHANKLEYQAPYFEAVEFEYSDVIQVSACSAGDSCPPIVCPTDGSADF